MQNMNLTGNIQCPYCGRSFKQHHIKPTKEHVIGRNFVPKNYIQHQWNVILDACEECNNLKGRLESGISLISHLSLDKPKYPTEVHADLIRKLHGKLDPSTGFIKGGATHPEMNIPIRDSSPQFVLQNKRSNLPWEVTFVAPPQAEDSEKELALMQVQAFYYYRYNYNLLEPRSKNHPAFTEQSVYLQEKYIHPLFVLRRTNWGHITAIELINRVKDWTILLNENSANGYFRILIKEAPNEEKATLFWALEWNKNVRIIGVVREPNLLSPIENNLPQPSIIRINNKLSLLREIPLKQDDDILFD